MIENNVVLSAEDKKMLKLLDDFLPEKIFDMHMHIGSAQVSPDQWAPGSINAEAGDEVTMDTYLRDVGPFFPNAKKIRANMILFPSKTMADPTSGNRDAGTALVVRELQKHPECVGEIMVCAADTVADIEKQLIHPQIRGFKCYHITADKPQTWQCGIGEYLPDSAWQVANERGMCITLHMVRDQALADAGNRSYILEMSDRYPNAKLILAHAARSFASWTAFETVRELADHPNVYFDLSAVCEPTAFYEILRTCGHKRVFWGSDYPVSAYRGKCVSIGSTFLWLYREQLEMCSSKTNFSPCLVGTENLLATRMACKMLDLDREAVADIFYNNAMELFGLQD